MKRKTHPTFVIVSLDNGPPGALKRLEVPDQAVLGQRRVKDVHGPRRVVRLLDGGNSVESEFLAGATTDGEAAPSQVLFRPVRQCSDEVRHVVKGFDLSFQEHKPPSQFQNLSAPKP
jgi:hypothetical protein